MNHKERRQTKLATDEEGKVNESRQAQITAIMTASSEERTKELNEKLENLDFACNLPSQPVGP